MAEAIDPPERSSTHDSFFGGRLHLRQPTKGHRAGTDAVLLAAAVARDFAGHAFDAGAGVGTAGLGVALACPAARIGLIENDQLCVDLATENIVVNGFADRVIVHGCDLLSGPSRRAAGLVPGDLVITNPPFYASGAVRQSPDARRRAAHVGAPGGLEAWIAACLALLRPHGALVMIHTAEAVPLILATLARGMGAVTVLPVYTKPDAVAKRILLRAIKGSRAPFALAPPLLLHDGAASTITADAINGGMAALAW